MLKERLLKKDFYLENMSMFLKDSFGMIDREETYRAILNNVNDIADDLISRIDIFNLLFEEDYFERNKPAGMTIDAYKSAYSDKFLDLIAGIFGIQRTFNIQYYGANYNGHYGADTTQLYSETITLNNRELLIYIQVIITKLNYQGTTGEIKTLYYGENTEVQKLKIFYVWDITNDLTCNVYFCNQDDIEDSGNYNSNIVKLFLSDKLLIESLGIQYKKYLGLTTFIASFDVNPNPNEDDPDIVDPPVYVFDPDFTEQGTPGFSYAVFG